MRPAQLKHPPPQIQNPTESILKPKKTKPKYNQTKQNQDQHCSRFRSAVPFAAHYAYEVPRTRHHKRDFGEAVGAARLGGLLCRTFDGLPLYPQPWVNGAYALNVRARAREVAVKRCVNIPF